MQYKKLTLSEEKDTKILTTSNIYSVDDIENNPQSEIAKKLKSIEKYLDKY